MSTTADESVSAAQPQKKTRATTYHVLVLVRDEEEGPLWRYIGPVDATNQDAANKLALKRAGLDRTVSANAVPGRSWSPQVYTPDTDVRFVRGTAAAK